MDACNIADLRAAARRRLPKMLFDCVDRGAEDEVSLRANRAAFEQVKLRPRALRDVSQRSQETTLFGRRYRSPMAAAPTGFAGLLWRDGEVALARAAAAAGIPYTLSHGSIISVEELADKAGGELWFQLFIQPDRAQSERMVARAHAAGCTVLMATVDTPAPPNREYNQRNHFSYPFRYTPRNVADVMSRPGWAINVLARLLLAHGGLPRPQNTPDGKSRPEDQARLRPAGSVDWDDIRALRRQWTGPLLIKGLLNPIDAVTAVECGVDGIVVSNHGDRVLDGGLAPLEALPAIVDAVGERLTILMDGGVRRGVDIAKALTLGARAVLVGRGPLYGLAADGQAGATRALAILREEFDRVMAQLGCRSVDEIDRALLFREH